MTRREWLAATWAEWAPSYRAGRLDIGRFVIMNRAELARWSWEHTAIGAALQQDDPGTAARLEKYQRGEAQQADSAADVRHLRVVRA